MSHFTITAARYSEMIGAYFWRQLQSNSARFPNREYDGGLIRGTGDLSTTWSLSFGNLATGEGNLALASWQQRLPVSAYLPVSLDDWLKA
jgi:hypothetical protein